MKLHLIIGYLLQSLSTVSGQGSQICSEKTESVFTSPEVLASYALVAGTYRERTLTTDPVIMRTMYKWEAQKDSAVYSRMKNSCEREDGHTLCDVTTKVRFQQEINGQEGQNRITEKNKPVCFPPTCADSEVSILEATPARCNPDTMPCEIGNYEVNCPAPRNVTANATCSQTFNTVASPFFIQRAVLETALVASCGSAVAGVANNLCSVQIGDVTVETIKDFTGWETNSSYLEHEVACLEEGGQMCHVDMKMNYILDQGSIGKADVRRTYKQFPLCSSSLCAAEDIPFLVEDRVANIISGGACNITDGTCSVSIEGFVCDGGLPTPPKSDDGSNSEDGGDGDGDGDGDGNEPVNPQKTEAPTKAPTKDATSSGLSLLAGKMTTFVSFACAAVAILSQNWIV